MTPQNDDPDDPPPGDPPTLDRADDRRAFDKPLCRVFGGPTSHRVQFAGFESYPAATTDVPDDRPAAEPPDHCDVEFRSAGGRAISAVLEHRRAGLVRALDPLADAYWRGEPPEAATLREARSRLYELEAAIEEYAARACAETEPWESAAEHVPEARLLELLQRGGQVQPPEKERADHDESRKS